jgi:hypothetical protein
MNWRIERRTPSSWVRRWSLRAMAILVLIPPFTAHTQNKTAPVTKLAPPHTEDAQLYRNATLRIPLSNSLRLGRSHQGNARRQRGRQVGGLARRLRAPSRGHRRHRQLRGRDRLRKHRVLSRPQESRRLPRPADRTRDRQWLPSRRRALPSKSSRGNCCALISSRRSALRQRLTTNSPCASARWSCSRKVRSCPSPSSPAAMMRSTISWTASIS